MILLTLHIQGSPLKFGASTSKPDRKSFVIVLTWAWKLISVNCLRMFWNVYFLINLVGCAELVQMSFSNA